MDRTVHTLQSHKMFFCLRQFCSILNSGDHQMQPLRSNDKQSIKKDILAFANGQLKDGCTFIIKLKSSIHEKKMPDNPTAKFRPKYRNNFSDGNLVTIVTNMCEGGGQYRPSTQQHAMIRFRSGVCIKNFSETEIFTPYKMLKHNEN